MAEGDFVGGGGRGGKEGKGSLVKCIMLKECMILLGLLQDIWRIYV